MKRKILVVLSLVSCFSMLNAEDTVNFEEDNQKEVVKQEKLKEMKNLVTKIDILLDEAILVGEDSLASLEKNLNFLTRVETDAKFRDCVVLKENRRRVLPLRESAKELLDSREITQKQYSRYIEKQQTQVNKMRDMLQVKIPQSFDFSKVSGLSNEIVEKLTKINPPTLFNASEISGVTPASLEILHIYIKMAQKAR